MRTTTGPTNKWIVAYFATTFTVFLGGSALATTGIVVVAVMFGMPMLAGRPRLDPEAVKLDFILGSLPTYPALEYEPDAEVYSDREARMVRDYAAGILSSEGFAEFMGTPPVYDKSYGEHEWVERADGRKFVKHYKGVPVDEWNCAERGHVLDDFTWDMATRYDKNSDGLYGCCVCAIDFSEQGVYGSVLFDTESEAA